MDRIFLLVIVSALVVLIAVLLIVVSDIRAHAVFAEFVGAFAAIGCCAQAVFGGANAS